MANKKVSQQLLTLEHRLERQSDTIKNIQENVDNTSKYQDLRQDVLKSQGSLINRWLSVIGIFLSVIMIFGAYRVFVVEDKIDSFNELLKEAESTLIEIKTHEKKAKKYEEKAKVSAEIFFFPYF
jgi:predicted PurR-regulated permease PerM